MKAIIVSQYGGPEVLKYQDWDIGQPQQGQVLVKVEAAGVNFIDIYQRKGIYPQKLPYIPGLEASGTIEAVGPGVKDFKKGDRIAFLHEPGAYAEYALVNEEHLILLPSNFSFIEGAAFPLQGMTAHYLLHEFYTIQNGDFVLIHAAAGGMGLLLTQWATHMGAKVIGTVSSEEKALMAKKAGAFTTINYSTQNFPEEVKRITQNKGVPFIIDGVGKSTFPGNLEAAALRGHIVIFGSASGPADPISPNILMKKSLTLSGGSLFNYILDRKEFLNRAQAVINGMEKGWLKLNIDKEIPLKEAFKAHQLLEGRQTKGKIILTI
jgi:NADPH2:quinone reductase